MGDEKGPADGERAGIGPRQGRQIGAPVQRAETLERRVRIDPIEEMLGATNES